jgi:hypothetical protein
MRIKKEVNMGLGHKLYLAIDDGIAVMTCNHPEAIKKMFEEMKKQQMNISWDVTNNAMIENFPGLKAEEIEEMLDRDINTAHKKQKEVIRKKSIKPEK